MKHLLIGLSLLAVAACSSSTHNEADIEFAQQMIPHHQQAIVMSDMATRAAGAEVRALAARIKAAQGPEITQMKSWLRDWDEPAATGHMDGMAHMGPGMMTGRQLDGLKRADGGLYDRMWLSMMIEHHRGAIAMAKTEIADGESADAIDLARTIVKAQTEEIELMKEMLE